MEDTACTGRPDCDCDDCVEMRDLDICPVCQLPIPQCICDDDWDDWALYSDELAQKRAAQNGTL